MAEHSDLYLHRKKEHIDLCLTDKVSFRDKTSGFDHYDFEHYAITEVEKDKIDFTTWFLKKKTNYPFLISSMSKKAAGKLLETGIKGIDVAGAGGTSWTAVEILRSNKTYNLFWDWGMPTSFCLKEVCKLRKEHKFIIIGSGGINTPFDAAKAFALGADIVASARVILQVLEKGGVSGVMNLILGWFEVIKKIMFLTGSNKLNELRNKIILKEKLF